MLKFQLITKEYYDRFVDLLTEYYREGEDAASVLQIDLCGIPSIENIIDPFVHPGIPGRLLLIEPRPESPGNPSVPARSFLHCFPLIFPDISSD